MQRLETPYLGGRRDKMRRGKNVAGSVKSFRRYLVYMIFLSEKLLN